MKWNPEAISPSEPGVGDVPQVIKVIEHTDGTGGVVVVAIRAALPKLPRRQVFRQQVCFSLVPHAGPVGEYTQVEIDW